MRTGDASKKDKFLKWAETIPYTVGNPLYIWTHLELRKYFGIYENFSPKNASSIYDSINGNSNKSKIQFEDILKSIAKLVLGNNVQQVKVENGKFLYTTDGTNWSTVDNNVWGSMARYMEELSEEKKVEIKRRLDEYLRQYHEDPDNLEEELKLDDLDVVNPYSFAVITR